MTPIERSSETSILPEDLAADIAGEFDRNDFTTVSVLVERLSYPRASTDWEYHAARDRAEVERLRDVLARLADSAEFGMNDGDLMRNVARQALGVPLPEDDDA